jgi:hypothetical protein
MLDNTRWTSDAPAQLRAGRRLALGTRGWVAVVTALVAFVLIIEAVARHYGIQGPIVGLVSDTFGRALQGEVKIAGLLLALVCMPHFLRWPVLGAALTIEVGFNVQRLLTGNSIHIGNGVMLALAGTVVYAVWRLRGREREATLKAVGLGFLLIVMSRVGDTWLNLSAIVHPRVLDDYVEIADRALGAPSWVVGQVVTGSPVLSAVLHVVYLNLPVGAAVIAFFQLRNAAAEGFPRHHIVRTFLLIGMIGPVVYFLFPVVGPTYAFGHDLPGAGWLDVWPSQIPLIGHPVASFYDQTVPRNCMPSLHTAWAMSIFLHGWRGSRTSRVFGTVWLIATVTATLGFGYHYGVDVLAGMIFTLTLETALTRPENGWYRHRFVVIGLGVTAFVALLLATRFGATQLLQIGTLAPILMLGAVAVTAWGYLTVDRRASVPVPAELPEYHLH